MYIGWSEAIFHYWFVQLVSLIMYGIVELRSKACEQRSKQGYQDITAHSGLAVSNGGG